MSDLPSTNHALGRPVHLYDTAGRVTLTYDLKGRVTAQTRTLLADITTEADWSGLESEGSLADIATWLSTDASLSTDTADTFAVSTAYDALDRVTEQTAPDSSRTVPTYDEGGRLSQVEVYVRGDSTATEIVSSITSNARGQREQLVYGNHTQTSYAYDPERLWLTGLTTTRSSGSSHGAATLQDLGFTRDAVGNITEITDDAQETVYFANSQVSPTRTFTYDALYRLVSARGREKDAQTQSTAFYADYAGAMGSIPQSGSGVLRRYTQSYEYDAAGNILEVKHQQGDAGTVLWRRGYAYETDNNQLLSTSLPGDDPDDPGTHSQTYAMNDRGAIVYLPHLKTGVSANLVRDFRDQLRKAELDNAGNVSWYAYDAAGERVWKVWDKGSVVEERITLGGYEVWRKRNGSGVLQEERQTLHVMDDQRRVAMIETLTVTGGSAVSTPTPRFRYQLDDQLGSALLEVDDDGGVISYEEYHPYGTTAWWAEDAAIEVSRKRYRYTGKERDEETGLQYHSARYYAPWLGRWDRPDPIGLGDGGNRWGYVHDNPVGMMDPNGFQSVDENQDEPGESNNVSAEDARAAFEQQLNVVRNVVQPYAGRRADKIDVTLITGDKSFHEMTGADVRGQLREDGRFSLADRRVLAIHRSIRSQFARNERRYTEGRINGEEYIDNLLDLGSNWRTVSVGRKSVVIATALSDEHYMNTLTHELVHVFSWRYRGYLEEGFAEYITNKIITSQGGPAQVDIDYKEWNTLVTEMTHLGHEELLYAWFFAKNSRDWRKAESALDDTFGRPTDSDHTQINSFRKDFPRGRDYANVRAVRIRSSWDAIRMLGLTSNGIVAPLTRALMVPGE